MLHHNYYYCSPASVIVPTIDTLSYDAKLAEVHLPTIIAIMNSAVGQLQCVGVVYVSSAVGGEIPKMLTTWHSSRA